MQKCIFYVAEHNNIFSKKTPFCSWLESCGCHEQIYGVKVPLRKAVSCEDFSYSCADDIIKYLVAKFVDETLNIMFISICIKLEKTVTIKKNS